MKKLNICVLGGTGFIGHNLLFVLARDGHRLRVLTRRREGHRDLLVIPTLELVETDVHLVSELSSQFKDCDTVINLTGILNPAAGPHGDFKTVHADLPAKVVEACRFNGIRRLLHMSALQSSTEGPSEYQRTKGAGEQAVLGAPDMDATVFKPSVVFGPEDNFFNQFARLLRLAPFMPLAGADTRFAPVFVGDVVEAFARCLRNRDSYGQAYELCGPKVYTLRELVRLSGRYSGHRRPVIGLGPGPARLLARAMEFLPTPPMTRDNLASMSVDSVCHSDGLAALGIRATELETVVPAYLSRSGRDRYLQNLRSAARRG
ncbi:MAG: complex I NDUFA9 subunit family protein [Gammaproteobacteria bacterium]|nr:complex I NDUFA9 subunit family protein [Gammaproteobacteria bacterium]